MYNILYIHINTYNVLYIHIYYIYIIHTGARVRTHHTKERDLQWNECRNEKLTTAPRSTAQWMKLTLEDLQVPFVASHF